MADDPVGQSASAERQRLDAWMAFRERGLAQAIQPGLERVRRAAQWLGLTPRFPLVTVAGTNGKGSVCAFLESMAQHAGLRAGVYSSPHFFRFSERIRIEGRPISDAALLAAFERVGQGEHVRRCSVFEFDTLAAMAAFLNDGPDLVILEVGLGGRLDATNVWDADVAVITPIALDHQQWLGETRERIGTEKAGIMRPDQPVVIADREPPASLVAHAEQVGAPVYRLGHEFDFDRREDGGWCWRAASVGKVDALPRPGLAGAHQYDNASAALMAMTLLRSRQTWSQFQAPLSTADIRAAIETTRLAGRAFRARFNDTELLFDVAHNPHAATGLSRILPTLPAVELQLAVFAGYADKDLAGIVAALHERFDHWFVAGLNDPRGLSAEETATRAFRDTGGVGYSCFADVATACNAALSATQNGARKAGRGARIVVFGSFLTVAQAMQFFGVIID